MRARIGLVDASNRILWWADPTEAWDLIRQPFVRDEVALLISTWSRHTWTAPHLFSIDLTTGRSGVARELGSGWGFRAAGNDARGPSGLCIMFATTDRDVLAIENRSSQSTSVVVLARDPDA